MCHLRVSVQLRPSFFCFSFASFPWTKTNKRKQNKKKKQGTLTPRRGSSYLTFFTTVQKRGTSGGKKSACHDFTFSLPEQISRPGHHSRKNVTQQKEQKWRLKTRLLLCRISVHFFFVFNADCTAYPQSTTKPPISKCVHLLV